MIGCLTETTTCVVAKPLVYIIGKSKLKHNTFGEVELDVISKLNSYLIKCQMLFLYLDIISLLAQVV